MELVWQIKNSKKKKSKRQDHNIIHDEDDVDDDYDKEEMKQQILKKKNKKSIKNASKQNEKIMKIISCYQWLAKINSKSRKQKIFLVDVWI